MRRVWRCFFQALLQVYACCITQTQAVAFNMFLAFFPALLLVLSVLTSSMLLRTSAYEMVLRLHPVLPPGSQVVVVHFLKRHADHPWPWTLLGVVGTLLAGTQVMKLLMDGFLIVHHDPDRPGFWSCHGRALLLLSVTLVPWLVAVSLTVFGRQVRAWTLPQFALPAIFRGIWSVLVLGVALAIAMLVLAVIYRVGRPGTRGWGEVLPGAAVATLLWWAANSVFGFYVRHMPYRKLYGGLGAAIGSLLWMQLTTLIVFCGAAFNAQICATRSKPPGLDGSRPRAAG